MAGSTTRENRLAARHSTARRSGGPRPRGSTRSCSCTEKFKRHTDRYGKAFSKQWSFIERHMIDPLHGGWYAETTPRGQLIGDGAKASQWKANYHTSRALMNVAAMLGRG